MEAACGSATPSEPSQQPHLLTSSATLEDYEAPLVTELSAPSYSIVSGLVSLSASATDDVGVTRMELYVSGSLVATSDSGSVLHDWDTTTQADGWTWVYTSADSDSVSLELDTSSLVDDDYYVYAVAHDTSGNSTFADGVLMVRNSP